MRTFRRVMLMAAVGLNTGCMLQAAVTHDWMQALSNFACAGALLLLETSVTEKT